MDNGLLKGESCRTTTLCRAVPQCRPYSQPNISERCVLPSLHTTLQTKYVLPDVKESMQKFRPRSLKSSLPMVRLHAALLPLHPASRRPNMIVDRPRMRCAQAKSGTALPNVARRVTDTRRCSGYYLLMVIIGVACQRSRPPGEVPRASRRGWQRPSRAQLHRMHTFCMRLMYDS